MAPSTLSFKISAGLKNIIGRDLISDKYIAVFELVKNSYDAEASKVEISFSSTDNILEQIVISDNGIGMNYNDIIEKWLFVAYSEKKDARRDGSYRNIIKREYAGAKGIGRFSCDRLGQTLRLITKTQNEEVAHVIDVDWNRFEIDDSEEFINIPVAYSNMDTLPSGFQHGTTLVVCNLREAWDRESLLRLKRSLMKLISPEIDKGTIPFDIDILVPSEKENDEKVLLKPWVNRDRDIVNGIVHNDIFEKLNLKTTNIEVSISEDGQTITSKLSDRGDYIFTVIEKNKAYWLLKDIHISVFYLNQNAKSNFTKQMGGVQPKNYGSVFIYKNGFRINPYGEPGQDFFGIDQRKAQGWKRFLGTREIMGRISIKGNNKIFLETSSRAHGFIQTPEVDMLSALFLEKALTVLEKYVVNIINWGEPLKKDDIDHIIEPFEVGDQIISQFLVSINPNEIISIEYNPELIKQESQLSQPDNISSSLKKLEAVAERTQDAGLLNLAQAVKKRTESILSQNIQLEKENTAKTKELDKAYNESRAREKQVYFLKGVANQDVTNLINGFHTIYTLIDAAKGNISFLKDMISSSNVDNKEQMIEALGEIYQSNQKAHKLADLAIHGNQALKQSGNNSINDFIRQYIDAGLALKGISYKLTTDNKAYDCSFDASSIGVIIDNIASNSIKAGATELAITIEETNEYVKVAFTDNGAGLAENMNPQILFEWGISSNKSNRGFGIGLYHIKLLVSEMEGTVYIDTQYKDGFRLVVCLKK